MDGDERGADSDPRAHVVHRTPRSSADRAVPAEDLYRGQHHLRLMRGVTEARREGLEVDVSIVSAGHGIVPGSKRLAPVRADISGSINARTGANWRGRSPSHATCARVLGAPADLHLVLLGEDYLDACEFG